MRYLERLNHGVDPNDQVYLLLNRANAPFQNDYRHEIDVSDELSMEFVSYY